MKKQVKNYFIFTHQFKTLSRKATLMRISRRLKNITGTFESIRKHKLKKKNLRSLYKKRSSTRRLRKLNKKSRKINKKSRKINKKSKSGRKQSRSNSQKSFKKLLNLSKLSRRKSKKLQKKKTKKSYIDYKLALNTKKFNKRKKQLKLNQQLRAIVGKNYKGIAEHAKFMTYGFRKTWFYSSYFTKKVLSCSITAASKNPTTQKSFLSVYSKNQRVTCPFKYIDVLTLMLSNHSVRNAFDTIFYQLFVQGVKNRLIHKIKWFKIGQSLFSSHQVLAKLCPWF